MKRMESWIYEERGKNLKVFFYIKVGDGYLIFMG